MTNPWLLVPAADYERHMSSPEVGQLQVLEDLLAEDLRRFAPRSLAVIGCATGNGFGRIDPAVTGRVVGVDLNERYLQLILERHGKRLAGLELVCSDILEGPGIAPVDLVHAALIFEYVPPDLALDRMIEMINPEGVLTAVLQLPSAQSAPVTNTGVQSVKLLSPILNLVDPETLISLALERSLRLLDRRRVALQKGKAFEVLRFHS